MAIERQVTSLDGRMVYSGCLQITSGSNLHKSILLNDRTNTWSSITYHYRKYDA